ncbi:MAG TPA: hypothetical protein VEG34_14325, partial [Thermoanaerobaculia bacterium]|nr:hypothetical protein [Thermoanaerobaculia bacterium]
MPRLILCFHIGLAVAGALSAKAVNAAGEGVVVVTVPGFTALAKAGVRQGDVFHAWERLPGAPVAGEPAAGPLASPVDWEWLATELAPRGPLRLQGERQGKSLAVDVPLGSWRDVEVRPVLPARILETYLVCDGHERGKRPQEALGCWTRVVEQLPQEVPWQLKSWIHYRTGRSLARLGVLAQAAAAYQAALVESGDARFRIIVRCGLSKVYEQQGRPDAASESLRLTLAEAPK